MFYVLLMMLTGILLSDSLQAMSELSQKIVGEYQGYSDFFLLAGMASFVALFFSLAQYGAYHPLSKILFWAAPVFFAGWIFHEFWIGVHGIR